MPGPRAPTRSPPRLSGHWEIVWSRPFGERPYFCTHVLARRADPSTAAERNRLAIARHFSRPLDIDAVYPLLHVADTSSDARFPYRLMATLAEDFDFQPKEIVFLAQLVEELDSKQPVLTPAERHKVRDVRAHFATLLAGSLPLVPLHLAAMLRDLYAAPRSAFPAGPSAAT
jgi:hypothetical protein